MVLTETWLSSKVFDTEILHCKNNYKFYRSDRVTRTGGGVLIAVSDKFHSNAIHTALPLELVCACVRFGYQDVVLCACYRPPHCSSNFCENLYDCLHALSVQYPNLLIFLLGDFNFPDIIWSSEEGMACHTAESKHFINVCNDFNLDQIVFESTCVTAFSSNTLDFISSIHYLAGLSDHRIVHFTCAFQPHHPQRTTKVIKGYVRADFVSICAELEVFTEQYMECAADRSVEENWLLFRNKINSLIVMSLYVLVGRPSTLRGSRHHFFACAIKKGNFTAVLYQLIPRRDGWLITAQR